ncbi:hypothetical protein ACJJTC_015909 [Scirpophaga incertulas]
MVVSPSLREGENCHRRSIHLRKQPPCPDLTPDYSGSGGGKIRLYCSRSIDWRLLLAWCKYNRCLVGIRAGIGCGRGEVVALGCRVWFHAAGRHGSRDNRSATPVAGSPGRVLLTRFVGVTRVALTVDALW